MRASVRVGVIAAAALVVFYAAVVGGASRSAAHLTSQAASDWYYLVPIVGGFGVQVGLVAELRRRHRLMRAEAAAGASGAGASTVGMIACCAHHIVDLVPFLGATAAAAFLVRWRVAFMLVGIGVNAAGIAVAGRRLRGTQSRARAEGRACAAA